MLNHACVGSLGDSKDMGRLLPEAHTLVGFDELLREERKPFVRVDSN